MTRLPEAAQSISVPCSHACVFRFSDPQLKNELSRVRSALQEELALPLSSMLEDVVNSLPSIAKEVDKESPKVVFNEKNIRILPGATNLVQSVFTHLLRNALDHGIETPEERVAQGKPAQGTIVIDVSASMEDLAISLKDDGRGLDIDKLFAKGVDLGLFEYGEKPDVENIAKLIFKSGVSTKDTVTTISGRGVGMDAVKKFLNDKDGDIQVKVSDSHGDGDYLPFEVLITLPGCHFVALDKAA